jgi:hypothetical protein
MQTVIVNLALDDRKRQALQNEIRTFLAENQGSEVTWKEIEKLPYLTACLKESLRYVSSAAGVWLLSRHWMANQVSRLVGGVMKRVTRVFPENDLHVEGWTVPKGVST